MSHILDSIKRQCVRVKKDGNRCAKSAMRGTTVCEKHGGRAPQTLKKARERLLNLVDPALSVLDRVMTTQASCVNCNQPCGHINDNKSAVQASHIVLDRTGFGPKSTIELESHDTGWVSYLDDDEFEQLAQLMERAVTRMPADESGEDDDEEVVH